MKRETKNRSHAAPREWLLFHWSPETGCVHEAVVATKAAAHGIWQPNWALDPTDCHVCWNDGNRGDVN